MFPLKGQAVIDNITWSMMAGKTEGTETRELRMLLAAQDLYT